VEIIRKISKRLKEKNLFVLEEPKKEMLKTIKFPKNPNNLHYLSDRLPVKNYEELHCKKVDINEFLQKLNENDINETQQNETNPNGNFPKVQISNENSDILSRNDGFSHAKNEKIKYKGYLKKPSLQNRKMNSPLLKPKYVNQKVGMDFLLDPININDNNIEKGRKLFGHNDYHNKDHNNEEIVYFLFILIFS